MNMYDMTLRQINHDGPIPAKFDADMDYKFVRIYNEVRLNDLTAEQLYLMITQGIMVDVLIPLAMEILRLTPMIRGRYRHGDLLEAVIEADKYFWLNHEALRDELRSLLKGLRSSINYGIERYEGIMSDTL